MKKTIFLTICKALCLVLCALFMLTACSDKGDGGDGTTVKEHCISTDGTCVPADEKQVAASHHSCWQGSLLRVLYKDIGTMTTDVYSTLTKENLLSLVILAFSAWMAFQILKHVSATTPESIGEFWTKVVRKAALCFVCGTLAASPENILYAVNNFVFPVYVTLLEFCANIIERLGKTPEAAATAIKLSGIWESNEQLCEAFAHTIDKCSFPDMSKIKMTTSEFPKEPLELMSCMACVVSDHLNVGYDVALRLLVKPFLGATFVAIFLVVAFTIAKLAFATYLVDSIFRLNMMIVIMPFLIMFYAFEQTRKWSVKGFQIILSSAAIMMCLGIILSMAIFAMEKLLVDPNMGMSFGDPKQYYNFGIVPMALIFMGFIIVKATGMAVDMAGQITGYAGDTKFQKRLSAVVQWIAGAAFSLLTLGAGKAITIMAQRIERVRAMVDKARKMQAKVQSFQNKLNRLAGRNNQEGEG